MQKCKKCTKRFNWKDIVNSIWHGYRPFKCTNCNTVYTITFLSRLLWVGFSLLPMMFFTFYLIRTSIWQSLTDSWTTYVNIIVSLGIIVIWICISQIILPFIIKYKEDK